MKTNAVLSPKSGEQLWGIYYTDREYARVMGDPLRTVVEAPTKLAADEAAAHLGFGDAGAHLVTAEQAKQVQWLRQPRKHRRQLTQKPSCGLHT